MDTMILEAAVPGADLHSRHYSFQTNSTVVFFIFLKVNYVNTLFKLIKI